MPIDNLRHRLRHPAVAQFVRYGIVGVGNTLLSVVIILLGAWLGVWHIAAYVVAYAAGAINGYRINRSWTFRAGASHRTLVVRYFVVQGAALVVSTALVYLLVDMAGLDKVLGQLLAVGVAVVGGFMGNRWWTFSHTLGEQPERPAVPAAQHIGP